MKSTLFSIILFLLSSPLFSQNDTLTFTIRGVRFDMVKIEGATYQKPNYYGDTMNRLNYHVPKPGEIRQFHERLQHRCALKLLYWKI